MRRFIHSTVFLLLIFASPASLTQTFRLEAEGLSSDHQTRFRVTASGGQTVYSTRTGEQFIFPVCLYSDVIADVTVRYSNDGDSDVLSVKVDGVVAGSVTTYAESKGGLNWGVMREATVYNVSLGEGLHRLAVESSSLDQFGVEIDCVDIRVHDDLVNSMLFSCSLVLGSDPPIGGSRGGGGKHGYVEQRSYVTPCPEEDNVHLAVYHDSVVSYAVTATNPGYRSYKDYKDPDFSTCPRLSASYWQVENISADNTGTVSQADTTTNVTVTNTRLNDVTYSTNITITFKLKGFRAGFIDADFRSILDLTSTITAGSTGWVKVSYEKRNGAIVALSEFSINGFENKEWNIPEMTWSGDKINSIYVSVSKNVAIQTVGLRRGQMRQDQAAIVYSNDAIKLQGFNVDFWWRKPAGEYLTLQVGGKDYTDFSYFALYVAVPWRGKSDFQQLLVIYQDGNVRLLPPPPSSPVREQWTPFGTSILLGKSNAADERPSAPIRTINFDPETLSMALTYYDGSSCTLTLTYTPAETVVTVRDLKLNPSISGPFAAFRSMFVEFGRADADSIQSDRQGPNHVIGNWTRMYGNDFMVYRKVESYHNTQSPDIRLTIFTCT